MNATLTSQPIAHERVFSFLREARRDRDLTPGAFRVLSELADATQKRGGPLPDPSLLELARSSASSRSNVRRLVAELVTRGLIRVTSRKKQLKSAMYEVLWNAYDVPAVSAAPVRKRRQQPRDAAGNVAVGWSRTRKAHVRQPVVAATAPEPVKTPESKARVSIYQDVVRRHGRDGFAMLEAEAPQLLREAVAAELVKAHAGYSSLRPWLFERERRQLVAAE